MPTMFCRKDEESRASARAGRATLPPDQLVSGVARLGRVASLGAAVTFLFTVIGQTVFRGAPPGADPGGLALIGEIGAILVSLGMFAVTRRKDLAPAAILDRGLVYQVAMGFMLALITHSFRPAGGSLGLGWSDVSIWLVSYTLMVPSTIGKRTLATVATALMDPLGLLVHVAAGKRVPGSLELVALFLPTAVAAVIALAGARVVHQLTVDAGQAREMGSYRLVSLIGRGGMGEVWRAEHRMLARPAAIKIIRPDGAGGSEAIARFRREAEATARLRSPHTVQLYDFGLTDDGCFYSVMELLDGFALDDLVEQWGPVPAARTVHILLGVCRSLREAHRQGLVHRDIKPGNVFLCRSGTEVDHVKVLDFGLVKEVAGSDVSVTQTGFVTGTPGFMAPEMALGRKDIDGRTDLYSLGCVGFYLLTGDTVFEKKTPIEMIMDHAKTPPPRPSQKSGVAIPDGLEDLLMDCLAKEPKDRPESAREVERRLWALYLPDIWTPDMAERWWAAHASALPPPGVPRPAPLSSRGTPAI